MTLLYRGTQTADPSRSARRSLSFTPCLPVALVYSAIRTPFRGARFGPESTVHAAHVSGERLDWPWISMSFEDALRSLQYGKPGGITEAEALRVLNYMNNRITGKAVGGSDFKYRILDEDGEPYEERRWGILQTGVSYLRDEFIDEPTMYTASRLQADTYIFADAPVVEVVAQRLGFSVLSYTDVFDAAGPVEELLGIDDIQYIDCVSEDVDLDDEYVPTHETVRPLAGARVTYEWSLPSSTVLDRVLSDIRQEA